MSNTSHTTHKLIKPHRWKQKNQQETTSNKNSRYTDNTLTNNQLNHRSILPSRRVVLNLEVTKVTQLYWSSPQLPRPISQRSFIHSKRIQANTPNRQATRCVRHEFELAVRLVSVISGAVSHILRYLIVEVQQRQLLLLIEVLGMIVSLLSHILTC